MVPRDGWELKDALPKHSTFWKSILSAKEGFMANIKFVGSGEKIFFGLDPRVGDSLLAVQFLDVFRCAREKEAMVHC